VGNRQMAYAFEEEEKDDEGKINNGRWHTQEVLS
jgi:hypothetical protein